MKKKILILCGGWAGHSPEANTSLFKNCLESKGHAVEVVEDFVILDDLEELLRYDLIIPIWTMGEPSDEQVKNLSSAVRSGVGLAGSHGGMGDAFRGKIEYQWMAGGQFVGHPYVGEYEITVTAPEDPIVAGLPKTFRYNSEQYYLLVDPAVQILAETTYLHEGRACQMPVVWKRLWGAGRVFYSALGHDMKEFSDFPEVLDMTINGLLWAARP